MPSFDVVSEIDMQELRNAIDQAQREITTRFDFKGTDSSIELKDKAIILNTESEQRLQALVQVLEEKLKGRARQSVALVEGISDDKARDIGKFVKALPLKGIQHQVQGNQLRIIGKKRDDLQETIAALTEHDFGVPLQFNNFRD
ncbi:MAG: hypothetical protein RLY23_841 [Actinomycetota bacterium]